MIQAIFLLKLIVANLSIAASLPRKRVAKSVVKLVTKTHFGSPRSEFLLDDDDDDDNYCFCFTRNEVTK